MFLFGGRGKIIRCPLNFVVRKRKISDMGLWKTIHHSDRGIQYCSDKHQAQMRKYGITPSMTESYDPYANAVVERVNGILKQDFYWKNWTWIFGECVKRCAGLLLPTTHPDRIIRVDIWHPNKCTHSMNWRLELTEK